MSVYQFKLESIRNFFNYIFFNFIALIFRKIDFNTFVSNHKLRKVL